MEFRKFFYHPYLRQSSEPLWEGGRQVLGCCAEVAEHSFLPASSGLRQVLGADLRIDKIVSGLRKSGLFPVL